MVPDNWADNAYGTIGQADADTDTLVVTQTSLDDFPDIPFSITINPNLTAAPEGEPTPDLPTTERNEVTGIAGSGPFIFALQFPLASDHEAGEYVVHTITAGSLAKLGGGGGGGVTSVTAAAGASLVATPTTGAVVVSRAALTGDVTASADSNATTLVGTSAVQAVVRAYRAALTGDVTASQDSNATTLVGTSAVQAVIRSYRAALTGDITAAQDSNATTLKNTGPGATGPIGDSSHSSAVTIDAQGRVTALSAVAISATAIGAIAAGATPGGDLAGAGSTYTTPLLTAIGSATGPTGSATTVPVVTIDAKGRVTALTAATIAIPESAVTNLTTDLAAKAPLASPALTGTPSAPTAAPGTNTTQLATTAFDTAAVAVETARAEAAEALLLPLAGGTMSGAIAMGTSKITGLGNGSGAQDAAAFGQIPTSASSIGGLLAANNLSDVGSASTARTNLGLGTAALISSTAGGDLSGTLPSPTVVGLQGRPVGSSAPGTGQFLEWNGSAWAPATTAPAPAPLPGALILQGHSYIASYSLGIAEPLTQFRYTGSRLAAALGATGDSVMICATGGGSLIQARRALRLLVGVYLAAGASLECRRVRRSEQQRNL